MLNGERLLAGCQSQRPRLPLSAARLGHPREVPDGPTLCLHLFGGAARAAWPQATGSRPSQIDGWWLPVHWVGKDSEVDLGWGQASID